MKTATCALLLLALAGPLAAQEEELPPLEFEPQLEVIVQGLGSTLRYEYRVTIPASSFPLSVVRAIPLRPLEDVRRSSDIAVQGVVDP